MIYYQKTKIVLLTQHVKIVHINLYVIYAQKERHLIFCQTMILMIVMRREATMSNSEYTPEQRDAINAYGKNVVVSASAGTGKTHVLSGKVNDLFKNKKINPENILVLTFTNSAASNMKIRIKKNLMKDPNIDRSLIDKINSAHIQTVVRHKTRIRQTRYETRLQAEHRLRPRTQLQRRPRPL